MAQSTVTVTSSPEQEALIAHWGLDEVSGTIAADNIGAADGTLVNDPLWRPDGGYILGALEFDGTDDAVRVGALDVVGGTGLTLSLWLRADDFGADDARLVSKANGTAEQNHYWMLSTLNGTQLRFRLKAGGTTTTLVSGPGQLQAGQ